MTHHIREQPAYSYEQSQGHPQASGALGFQFLAPFSSLSFVQRASIGQGRIFSVSQRDTDAFILFLSGTAITGLSAAQKFEIFNDQNQLMMYASEGTLMFPHGRHITEFTPIKQIISRLE